MDFALFVTETLATLWRVNDQDLAAALPKLTRTAENRLRVDLKISDADITTRISVETYPSFTLPAEADVVSSLNWVDFGPGQYQSGKNFDKYEPNYTPATGRIYNTAARSIELDYTVRGREVWHRWYSAGVDTPFLCDLTYTPMPASLIDDDDDLFNLYTAAYEASVYYQCSKFLKAHDDAAMYDKEYTSLVDSARQDQSHRKYAGGPLRMSMPREDVC